MRKRELKGMAIMKQKMNYNKYFHSLCTVILVVITSYNISFATQIRDVSGNDELLLEISQTELTRISVENDKISSLQFSNGILDVTTDTKLGEAYIKPRTDNSVNLFVSTKKGFVYKLLLNPVNIPSTQIILKNKNTFAFEGISKGISNDYERRLTDIILSIQRNIKIEGCYVSKVNQKVQSPIDGVKLKVVQRYVCKEYTGYKLEIIKKDDVSIQEKDFITPKTKAVKFYQNYLIVINKEDE